MRKKYVIANFKMNKIDSEVEGYMSTIYSTVVHYEGPRRYTAKSGRL